ncbi:Hypothetical predicted protein [Mytilus galloprovincialis]|uniref:Integrase-type domain-containing protein n=1 Tax=Mytilus galloprovincialis TaxID=29158 RepID=A0A8B6EJU8_MYTGA|nr:Hypothetical predicted protein [Mytilus galloprovincialis]
MVYGWSPYQLVFGTNPNLPNVLNDKPAALEHNTVSQTFANHLNALHSGRRAFIQAESSERIRRALRHKIRASGECFQHGDKVYYKRDDDNKWKGPGTVLGQDGKVVFVRHGSIYVRVHPCRLIRCGIEFNDMPSKQLNVNKNNVQPVRVKIHQTAIYDSDDEEENNNRNVEQNIEEQEPVQNENDQQNIQLPQMQNDDNEQDFAKDVQEWRTEQDVDEVNAVVVPQSRHNENQVKHAKQLEMDNWKSFKVYDEIPYSGQKLMSTRWVITEKKMNGERKVKARLVVRGFEEENEVKSDSPTVHKESLRLFLAIASTSEFDIHSIDIKAAFLQGKEIDRIIFVKPPKELSSDKPVAWKLNKCVYGLIDASRNWFLSVKRELLQLECIQSKLDPAIFYWHKNNNLEGLFLMHVDDFLWAGSEHFKKQVICQLRDKFDCGKKN